MNKHIDLTTGSAGYVPYCEKGPLRRKADALQQIVDIRRQENARLRDEAYACRDIVRLTKELKSAEEEAIRLRAELEAARAQAVTA